MSVKGWAIAAAVVSAGGFLGYQGIQRLNEFSEQNKITTLTLVPNADYTLGIVYATESNRSVFSSEQPYLVKLSQGKIKVMDIEIPVPAIENYHQIDLTNPNDALAYSVVIESKRAPITLVQVKGPVTVDELIARSRQNQAQK